MNNPRVIEFPPLHLELAVGEQPLGTRVLAGMLALAGRALTNLHQECVKLRRPRLAAVGQLRGTGRGIHFRDLIAQLEGEHPIELVAPFEDSMKVAGAVWDSQAILGPTITDGLAKLRWSVGADDLPMHVHEHSDRCIVVLKGRGFFHVSDQNVDAFDGTDVRSTPARERDVFIFTRNVVHSFSTLDEPMVLLSCQLPFLVFDDPRQYRLPRHIWMAKENPEPTPPSVRLQPAWTMLTMGP